MSDIGNEPCNRMQFFQPEKCCGQAADFKCYVNKTPIMRILSKKLLGKNLFSLILILVSLTLLSYHHAKRTAEQLVGESLQYFPLSYSMITLLPQTGIKPLWMFRFSYPYAFDEEFEIFTSLTGSIEATYPRRDIEKYLRKIEKYKIHPYSKEAAEIKRKEWKAEKQLARKKGMKLFKKSSFRIPFLKKFVFSNIEAHDNSKTYGVYFDNPEWQALLTPKENYPYQFLIEAIFPIKNNTVIEALINPSDIENAINTCLSHPYLIKYLANKSIVRIRIRITGDRLHWDTTELQQLLSELKGSKAEEKELRNSATVIIDGKEHQYFSFYLNSISRELIYTDTAANYSKPILVSMKATK